MEIDETKRITVFELANLPYFKRLLKKEPMYNALQANQNIHGSAYDLRMRSPSYNGNENKYLKSEQVAVKRKISIEKTATTDQYTSPFVVRPNMPPPSPYDKSPTQYPSPHIGKNALDVPRD
jgi:hypothetical protein